MILQSLGVKIGPGEESGAPGGSPFAEALAGPDEPQGDEISWTAAALARLERVPALVRPMAQQGIEHYARTNGHALIDDEVMAAARQRFGM